MRLRCKVDNDIWLLLLKELVHALTVADIELHKSEIRVVHYRSKCAEIACISELVQAYDSVVRVCIQHVGNKV